MYAQAETTDFNVKTKDSVGLLKFLGAVLLIVGTSIGGGMLSLPIITAPGGFVPSISYLTAIWLVMLVGALLILEVNLWLPVGSNMISMAGKTIGKHGQIVAWLSYLFLLYCLLSAYTAGGADVFQGLFQILKLPIQHSLSAILFTLIFGLVVWRGIKSVDITNRIVMLVKLSAYLLITGTLLPSIQLSGLEGAHYKALLPTITTMITSFGFAIIIPSLRTYFGEHVQALRRAICIGCMIPLICYIIWEAVIFGNLPLSGAHGLLALNQAKQPVLALLSTMSDLMNNHFVVAAAKTFIIVCVFTAFLGVSLCLTDFLADGLAIKKESRKGIWIYALTFIPPLVLVLSAPRLFIYGISYAGYFCILLLILMPAWMAWSGQKKFNKAAGHSLLMNKVFLSMYMLAGVGLMILGIYYQI